MMGKEKKGDITEDVIAKYIKRFCKKQSMIESDGYWVAGKVGGIYDIADMFLSFDEIKFDVDTKQKKELIIDHYWDALNAAMRNEPYPNYQEWCKNNTK